MNFYNVLGKYKQLLLQLMSCSASGKAACGGTPNAHCGYLKKKGSATFCLGILMPLTFVISVGKLIFCENYESQLFHTSVSCMN